MRKLIVIIYTSVFICGGIYAQTSMPSAVLKGSVTDNSGRPLEYVSVTVQDLGLSSSTDKNGNYSFAGINPGEYIVTFRRSGYEAKSLSVSITGKDTTLSTSLSESLIETGVIDVTGSFNAVDISKSTFPLTEISSRSLTKNRSQTLAETIQNIPGVSNISTGTGIGKPVIRGLSSQSVLVVHDGVKHESQQWGDEHGPELSLFDLDRIEILRGPASIIYGADGIGGVVNVISKPLEFSYGKTPLFYGGIVLGGFSSDNQIFGNLTLGAGFKNFGLKGHFSGRKTGNVKTPDGSFVINTVNGAKSISGGELYNSGSTELGGGANLGFNGKFGMVNLSYENFSRDVGIHEDPEDEPFASPRQQINTNRLSADGNFTLSKKFRFQPVFSYQHQRRIEFESIEDMNSDIQALHLELRTFDGSVKLHHELSENISGTFGGSLNFQKNQTLAQEKLIPNYSANTFGVFILEKFSAKLFTFSAGARFDTKNLNIKSTVFELDSTGSPVKILNSQRLTFKAFSGSAGAVYTPNDHISIFTNLGRGWRPPSEYELFVDGVHEGTGRYEKGIKTIDSLSEPQPEASLNFDIGVRLNYKTLSIQLSAYRNMVDNFIYPSPTQDTLDGHPVFNILQDKSIFYGYEYSVQFQPVKWIVLSANGDYVHTQNKATGNALPFTPPMKNIFDVKLQKTNLGKVLNPYIKLGTKVVSAQTNTDLYESKTDAYTLLSGGMGFDFEFAKTIASVDFSVDNIANTKYVDHLSRYKGYALNPGRSFNLQLTLPFRVN